MEASSILSFVDSVENKAGPRSVFKVAPKASHVPERAQHRVHPSSQINWQEWEAQKPHWSPRPLRLLPHPEPAEVTAELPDSPPAQFIWRKVLRRVARARGPERILPEWWRDELTQPGQAGVRDYYDVEDITGQRYWIYRLIKEHPVTVEDPVSDANAKLENESDTATETSPQATVCMTNWFIHGLF